MKKLNQLLADITAIKVVGNAEVEITSVTNDSREAKPGALDLCVGGRIQCGPDALPGCYDWWTDTGIEP